MAASLLRKGLNQGKGKGLWVQRVWNLRRSQFVRNVAVVASGTAGAQAITMAFAPFITRLYGPEAFGLLNAFMATIAIVTPVAALSYPVAIVLQREDAHALGIALLSAYLSIGSALLLALALWIGGDLLVQLLGVQEIGPFIFLVPLVILPTAWLQIAQQWLIRQKQFGVTARAAVLYSIILNVSKAGVGLFHPVATVLIGLQSVGQTLHAGLLAFKIRQAEKRKVPGKAKLSESTSASIWVLAKRHYDFPLYRMPQDFVNAVSQSLPVLMLASLFGATAAGFYSIGKIVIEVPSSLIGKAVQDVFYPRIAAARHEGEDIAHLILKATGGLVLIGTIPFGLVVMFGPELFGFVFGGEWVAAGEYARWLGLFFFFNFINKPSVAAVPVLGIQKGLLIYELFSTAGKVIGLLVGFFGFQSDLVAVALFSLIGVIAYSVMILWIIYMARIGVKNEEASR